MTLETPVDKLYNNFLELETHGILIPIVVLSVTVAQTGLMPIKLKYLLLTIKTTGHSIFQLPTLFKLSITIRLTIIMLIGIITIMKLLVIHQMDP
jgi:hypothetical protein